MAFQNNSEAGWINATMAPEDHETFKALVMKYAPSAGAYNVSLKTAYRDGRIGFIPSVGGASKAADPNVVAWAAHVATLSFRDATALFAEWTAGGHVALVRAVKAAMADAPKAPAGNVPQAPASVTPKAPASVPQAPGRKGKGG